MTHEVRFCTARDGARIAYDERDCGLSDRDVRDFSLDTRLGDLEAVIDAAWFERFALLGMSHWSWWRTA